MAQMIFNPNGFTAQTAKPMPVILVLDNSGSMAGDKINSLNEAVHDMLNSFKQSECHDASFSIAIVTFGTGIHLLQEMASSDTISWHDIPISDREMCKSYTGIWDDAEARGTPLGATLKIIKSIIEDKSIVPSRAYRPAVILVSDGHPTDSWHAPLDAFVQDGRSSKCDRWAMAIGQDADTSVLAKFIERQNNIDGTPRRLLFANDAVALKDNFKFITMTLTNSVAILSKSKILTAKSIEVEPVTLEEAKGNYALMQGKHSLAENKREEESGFEW